MNLNESVRDWINHKAPIFTNLDGVALVTSGETTEQELPFVGIYETGSEIYEQDGVIMRGWSVFEITVELFTVPVDEDEGGTDPGNERLIRNDLYCIIGDTDAIEFMNWRNGWRVFDIRTASPTTTAEEGRRITRFTLNILASPT